MFRRTLPQALCVLALCVWPALAYEDDIEVNYADSDTYYNEITDGETQDPTPSSAPCKTPDLTKWDKLFSMMENSQMRENMLLQYADDIIKVEMGSLRTEMLRFVSHYGGACGVAVETAGRRMALQLETRLRENLERLHIRGIPAPGNSAGNSNHQDSLLLQILTATRAQAVRLAKVETSCFGNLGTVAGAPGRDTKMGFRLPVGGGQREQEVTGTLEKTLAAVVTELKETRAELQQALRSSKQRYLPSGCETALLFPMRSRRIFTSVVPEVPLSLSSFTVCLWAKPSGVSNRTMLFSYGTRRNPYEIQLLLSGTSALFTIGGEAHLVEGRGVVRVGGASEWIHLCGAWSSTQGLAALWADGKKVASTPGVAEGHTVPDGGSLQLGQERNGCCSAGAGGGASGVPGFDGAFDAKLAFAGKMTGVNMWDRVLSEDEISQQALREGQGCERRGNLVAWGVTEMVPHGGAQFID